MKYFYRNKVIWRFLLFIVCVVLINLALRHFLTNYNTFSDKTRIDESYVKELEGKIDYLKTELYYASLIKSNKITENSILKLKNGDLNTAVNIYNGKSVRLPLENSFNYTNCNSSGKLKISFFNREDVDFYLNFNEIEVTTKNSCIIVVLLKESFDFMKLHEYIEEDAQTTNLLFIDLYGNYYKKIENSNSLFIRSSLYASFTKPFVITRNQNLFFHFSLYNITSVNQNQSLSFKRKYLITYHEPSESDSVLKRDFLVENSISQFFDLNCTMDPKFPNLCYEKNKRIEILRESTFTLIYTQENSEIRLLEALSAGTIPIVINIELKLPLDNLIDWNQVVIKVAISQIKNIHDILASFSNQDILTRRQNLLKFFQSYFFNQTVQFRTLIAAVNERFCIFHYYLEDFHYNEIKPQSSQESSKITKNLNPNDEYLGPNDNSRLPSTKYASKFTYDRYSIWNKLYFPFCLFPSTPFNQIPPSDNHRFGQNNSCFFGKSDPGICFFQSLNGNHEYEQFTIVILTYKREKILDSAVDRYIDIPYLNRIIIVWNALDTEPSEDFLGKYSWAIKQELLKIIKVQVNSLNNRFLPYNLIETDAILSIDDDTILRKEEIIFAFRVWRESRDRIVGFPARFHTFNPETQSYKYQSSYTCEYSMVLTGASFYHRFYNYYYTFAMNSKIRQIVDDNMNCEDLAFNYMVADLTRKAPLKVTSKWDFYCKECERALSNNAIHYQKRTKCLNKFNQVYGYNPLLYSQYRADSVLYNTNGNIRKCFRFV